MEPPPSENPDLNQIKLKRFRPIWRILLISNMALGVREMASCKLKSRVANLLCLQVREMPGTITVSVLDVVVLQSSSSEPSQISIKVSMGKREHQTLDKGDFSFPLTTFRDNLVVTLLDAQGNEISHAGVETRKVVEKGVLDEVFPLEGGGHVHMKLQFLLSDQDRQRIRTMREMAMKKKQQDLLNNELRSPELAIAVDSKVAPSVQPKPEMSDSHKRPLQNEMVFNEGNPNPHSNVFKKGKPSPEYDEGSQSIQKNQTSPVDTKTLRAAFVPNKEIGRMISVETSETAASSTDVSLRTTHLKESSHLERPGSVAAPEDQIPVISKQIEGNGQKKQSPLKKSSSVRNMISAFESSQNQDVTPKIRSISTKSELSKVELKAPPKKSEFNEVETEKNGAAKSESGVRNSADLPNRECVRQEEEIGSTGQLAEATSSQDTKQFEKLKSSSEDLVRSSTGELSEAALPQDMMQFEELKAIHLQTASDDMVRSSTGELSGAALPQDTMPFEELKAKHLPTPSEDLVRSYSGEFSSATLSQDLRPIEELRAKHAQTSSDDTVRSSKAEVSGATVPQDLERSYSAELSWATSPQDVREFKQLRAKDMQTSSENSVRSSTCVRASVSGRKSFNQLSRKSFSGKQHPDRNLVTKNDGKGTKLQKSQRGHSEEFARDQHHSSETYGSWIFPGEGKHLCLTTSGKEMMNLLGGFLPGDESQPGNVTAQPVVLTDTSQRQRNTELEDSAADAENSIGPLGQVMRVVIMVGFAALVLLTRQRKPR